LMSALGKAIKTENRRIKREVVLKQYEREAEAVLPDRMLDLEAKIAEIYKRLLGIFKNRSERFPFSGLEHGDRDEKIHNFVSLLHLDSQQRIWLEQEKNYEEIWIWLKHLYEEKNKEMFEQMRREALEEIEDIEEALEQQEEEDEQNEKIEEITGFAKRIE